MKKRINIEAINSELTNASRFFQPPPVQPSGASEPPQSAPGDEKRKVGNLESRKRGKEENRRGGNEEKRIVGKEEKRKSSLFDINVVAERKDSFFFTDEEFRAIKRFGIEMEDVLDMGFTKTDLARCAFKLLLDDYQQHGEQSVVITYLRGKKTKSAK